MKKLSALLATTTLALTGVGILTPSMALAQEPTSQVSKTTNQVDLGQGRSVTPIEKEGLKLSLLSGDSVTIKGFDAFVKDSSGKKITKIHLEPKNSKEFKLSFDEKNKILRLISADTGNRCAGKWEAAGWNIAWDALVCVPAGVAFAPAGFACGAAGTLTSAGMSC